MNINQRSNVYVQALTRINFLSKKEVAELPNLLLSGETILAAISGFCGTGSAILCVTSKRLLVIDKKPRRLLARDFRFNMILEVKYSQSTIMSVMSFLTGGREIRFYAWYRKELYMLSQLVQQKMFEVKEPSSLGQIYRSSYVRSLSAEGYLLGRIERWKRAARLGDMLSVSLSAGRRAMELGVRR